MTAPPLVKRAGIALYPVSALALLVVPLERRPLSPHDEGTLLLLGGLLFVAAIAITIVTFDTQRPPRLAFVLHACAVLSVAVVWARSSADTGVRGGLGVAALISGIALVALLPSLLRRRSLYPAWRHQPPRFLVHGAVRYQRDGRWMDASIFDLSERGCFISGCELSKGHETRIELVLPGFLPLRCDGTVRWQSLGDGDHPPGAGIELHPEPAHERQLLAELVDATRHENSVRGIISPRGD